MQSFIQSETLCALSGEITSSERKKMRIELTNVHERIEKLEHRLDCQEVQSTPVTEKKPFWKVLLWSAKKVVTAIIGFILVAPRVIDSLSCIKDSRKTHTKGYRKAIVAI